MTSINENNIEKWLFDYHEGNLNQGEREALEKYIMMHPSLESEMDAWSKAYVEDESFEYHNADSLIQDRRKIGWIGWSSAAAILITGITLSFLFWGETSNNYSLVTFESDVHSDIEMKPVVNTQDKNAESSSLNYSGSTPDNVLANKNEFVSENNADAVIENDKVYVTDANMTPNNNSNSNIKNAVVETENRNNNNVVVENKIENHSTYLAKDEVAKLESENSNKVLTKTTNDVNNNTNSNVQIQNTNTTADVVEADLNESSHTTELVSAIPGKSDQGNVNEFAHLEPVKMKVEKDIILNQALTKLDFESEEISGSYASNPEFAESDINLTSNLKNASSRKTMSKFVRDIKRAFNNPAGVTNLRDPNLIIPGYNAISFNPAMTGGALNTRIQMNYFNQWTGTSAMQHVGKLSVDSYVYGMRGGIGFDLTFRDYGNGMYRNYEGALTYSPKINLGKFLAIEPALKFKMGAYTLDADKVVPGGQIEMERGMVYQTFNNGESPVGSTKIYYDLGVGLFVNTKWFYAGFSMDNLFRHKENIYSNDLDNQRRAPYTINAVIGTDFESRNKNFTGSPFIVYQHYDKYDEFYFGSNFRVYWGTMGLSVSDKGNISAQAGIQFKKFKMTYQYDWTKSKMMGVKGHSHQLMFRFSIKPKRSFAKNLEY